MIFYQPKKSVQQAPLIDAKIRSQKISYFSYNWAITKSITLSKSCHPLFSNFLLIPLKTHLTQR